MYAGIYFFNKKDRRKPVLFHDKSLCGIYSVSGAAPAWTSLKPASGSRSQPQTILRS